MPLKEKLHTVNITREDLPDRQVALTIEMDDADIEPALQKPIASSWVG